VFNIGPLPGYGLAIHHEFGIDSSVDGKTNGPGGVFKDGASEEEVVVVNGVVLGVPCQLQAALEGVEPVVGVFVLQHAVLVELR